MGYDNEQLSTEETTPEMDVGREYEQVAASAQEAATPPSGAMRDFGGDAQRILQSSLQKVRNVGAMGDQLRAMRQNNRSSGSETEEDDGLPKGPGFTYGNHIFRKIRKKAEEKKSQSGTDEVNIYTDQQEALKTAIGICGVYSDKNPGGMPIEIKAAKKLWFGKDAPDGFAEAEFHSLAEMGDRNIDPKRIRKFVNYDGSMTWEVLNEDKTVMSRFTMGEFAGTKVFTQGGYNKFAELLKKVQSKTGMDASTGFDAVRGQFAR